MPSGIKALIGLVIILFIGFCGARIQAWHDNQTLSALKAQYANEKQAIAEATAKQAEHALVQQHILEGKLAFADAQHYKELKDAQDQNGALRARLASGAQRLFVRVKTPADCGRVPDHSASPSVGDGETYAQLDPATSGNLTGISADGDAAIIQLKWFQDREPLIQQVLQPSP